MKKNLSFIILLVSANWLMGQNYVMNSGGSYGNQSSAESNAISTCSGNFYDSGGAGNSYNNGMNRWLTFCPGNPGEVLTFNFTSFSTEASGSTIYDYLEVYDENGILYTTLGGDITPFTLVAPVAGECLTFHFISDASTRLSGWAAQISCVTPCLAPTAAMANTSPINICSVDALSPGNLTASFDASASFTNDAFPVVSYEWDWGDGTNSTTATSSTTHTYSNVPNIYLVSLKVRTSNTDSDPAGCASLNSVTKEVRILPPVDFSGTSSTINVNCGQSINLNGLASPQIITQDPPSSISAPIFLPDGTGAVYNTYLNMAGLFPTGATITSACYPTVTVNLETFLFR